jgi:succinate dehydrogenase/fumarate reductase flavoprotein subunit
VDNLFCAGEKAGLLVGHTEAIVTGTLAGYNAARYAMHRPLLILPRTLAIGEAIAYVREQMQTPKGLTLKYTFSGSVFFQRMQELSLYTTDVAAIRARVDEAGLTNVFACAGEEEAMGETLHAPTKPAAVRHWGQRW